MKRRDLLALFCNFSVFGTPLPKPFGVSFVDVAAKAGLTHPIIYGGVSSKKYILETNGCGVAFFDYDSDGWQDIFLPGGSRIDGAPAGATNRLYKNNRDGTFTDVTKRAGLERTVWASGVAIGDYDNDGHDDLFITCWGQNILYRNNGNGTFTDVTREAGLLSPRPRWGAGCTFVDYDRDGFLDLFVGNYLEFDLKTAPLPGAAEHCMWKGIPVNCGPRGLPTSRNYLYHNNGDGTFTDVSEESGIARERERYAMTAVAADFDDDGWPDIFVACDSTASILYKNRHDGTFTDVALEAGVAYNEDGREQAGMGVGIGDTTNRGRLDIFKTHFADDTPILYRNRGNGTFEDVTTGAGLGSLSRYLGWGAGLADLDNDGLVDIFFVNGNVYPELEKYFDQYKYKNPRKVLRNVGGGAFEDVSESCGPGALDRRSSRGAAFGDFDNDGDIDVLVMNMNEPPSLLRNDYQGDNRWLKIKLAGTRSNRSAIGAKIIVTLGGATQTYHVRSGSSYCSQSELPVTVGLGTASQAAAPCENYQYWRPCCCREQAWRSFPPAFRCPRSSLRCIRRCSRRNSSRRWGGGRRCWVARTALSRPG
ncbi:MAG: CRTAC1 family protein [Acidobacteria bacterium]|nr:CRTAC1 family protein [Acidobacteriota bacterium]